MFLVFLAATNQQENYKWHGLLLNPSPCHEGRVHGSHHFQFLGIILAPEFCCFFCCMKHDTCVVNHFVPFPNGWTVFATHTCFHPFSFQVESSDVVLNESFLDICGHGQELFEMAFSHFWGKPATTTVTTSAGRWGAHIPSTCANSGAPAWQLWFRAWSPPKGIRLPFACFDPSEIWQSLLGGCGTRQ